MRRKMLVGVPRGTSLIPFDDPRHGEPRGYRAGCRLDCCRRAAAAYEAQLVLDRAAGRLRRCPTIGLRRRMYALMAIGHTQAEIGAAAGGLDQRVLWHHVHRTWVSPATRDRILRAYDQLCMTPGRSQASRRAARASGWPSPLAWDDDTIDDPRARPITGRKSRRRGRDPIEVERAVAGEHVDLHSRDLDEVVRRLNRAGRGMNDNEISSHIGVTARTVLRSRNRQGLQAVEQQHMGVS